ncbi:MAG TPA: L-lactate permease [Tepidisphaeraceae bacterium]|nr:L-lactate permease [Tepidisphaeraceae bacterium]
MEYLQNYNPANNWVLSTLMAAGPVVTLLYLLAIHPRRMPDGSIHKGIEAHKAAAIAVIVALFIARIAFHMPSSTAGMSFVYGALYGLFPIGMIVIAAMFLYTITLVSGTFETLKRSVASISDDKRIQAILIAFSFGAFIEGAAGFGTPVAIAGALMVGLGFRPLQAAILCLIANTAPVAFGAVGTPITALNGVTQIDTALIARMAARQLPFFSLIVPIWMTAVQVRMDGKPWRCVWEVWPALLVGGGSFAITQFLVGHSSAYLLVDIAGGVISIISVALFLQAWQPPKHYDGDDVVRAAVIHPTKDQIAWAWLPWLLLSIFVFVWGLPSVKTWFDQRPGALILVKTPYVDGVVYRTPPVVPTKTTDAAVFKFNWLSAPSTGVLVAGVIAGLLAGLSARQWMTVIVRTAQRLSIPLLTISLIVGMGFVTKYCGMDAVLGLAFTRTGSAYPFFAAMLGWLGVALTGSDTSSNVMFGSMQKITAEQLHLSPVLIVTANSTGGVMGKMIDAQSIVVATAACYENRNEGKLAAGPIFRGVFPHSIALAILMGLLVWLQAYVWPWMVP